MRRLAVVVCAVTLIAASAGSSGADTTAALSSFSQRGPLAGTPEAGDRFGDSLASSDFNGDGFADLAIASSEEAIGDVGVAGMVHVLYGAQGGIDAGRSQAFTQNGLVRGGAEQYDLFGSSLAVGDFDGDGYGDLAIGSPGEYIGASGCGGFALCWGHGLAVVLYGTPAGLTTAGRQIFQNPDGDHFEELFSTAMAAGDFDGDGHDELAVGALCHRAEIERGGETIAACPAGAVHVFRGSAAGLTRQGYEKFTQRGPIRGADDGPDRFGASLAAADFDGDGLDDLAIGVPDEGLGSAVAAGRVVVLHGAASGLTTTANQSFTQRGPLASTPEELDHFGRSLAVGDLDGDGRADLVIGVPEESLGRSRFAAGMAHLVYGADAGLTVQGTEAFTQRDALRGGPGVGHQFAAALATGDFNADGADDVLFGAPQAGGGIVHVLYGRSG